MGHKRPSWILVLHTIIHSMKTWLAIIVIQTIKGYCRPSKNKFCKQFFRSLQSLNIDFKFGEKIILKLLNDREVSTVVTATLITYGRPWRTWGLKNSGFDLTDFQEIWPKCSLVVSAPKWWRLLWYFKFSCFYALLCNNDWQIFY